MVPPRLSNFPLTGGLKVEIIFKLKNFDKIYMFFKFQSSNVSRKKNKIKTPKIKFWYKEPRNKNRSWPIVPTKYKITGNKLNQFIIIWPKE